MGVSDIDFHFRGIRYQFVAFIEYLFIGIKIIGLRTQKKTDCSAFQNRLCYLIQVKSKDAVRLGCAHLIQ